MTSLKKQSNNSLEVKDTKMKIHIFDADLIPYPWPEEWIVWCGRQLPSISATAHADHNGDGS